MVQPSRLAAAVALACALAISACATAPPVATPEPRAPSSPEARATALFLRGRTLELEGRLKEAAIAYEGVVALDPESARLQRHLAQIWARMGDAERALDHATRALELDPDDGSSRRGLAQLYMELGRAEEAIELLAPRFRDDLLEPEGLFTLATLYLELDRPQEGEPVARRMIERDRRDSRGYLLLSSALGRLGRIEAAEKILRDAIAAVPGDPRFYDALASARRQAEDPRGEIAVLREKVARFSADPPTLLRIARLHEALGEDALAEAALEELASSRPNDALLQFQLGVFHFQKRRYGAASGHFERVLARPDSLGDPRRADLARYLLGRAYGEQDRPADAMRALEAITPASEHFADARLELARLFELEGQLERAVAEVRQAAALVPDELRVQTYLASLLQRSGDLPGAVTLLEDLIEGEPEQAELYYALGVIYGEAGEEDRALELMERVLDLDDQHASALNYVGYTWADRGTRLDEAESLIRRAIDVRPDDGYITDSLGWVHYQQGLKRLAAGDAGGARDSFARAIEQLERALDLLEEDDPVITRHLADAYRSVSRFSDALAAYQRALALDPEEDEAAEIRRQIELIETQLLGGNGR